MFASHNNNSNEPNSPVDPTGSQAGFSDEKAERAWLQKIAKLKRQLLDTQNSMELLVMQKEEWSLKYDGMRETVAGLQEMLKREKAKHLDFERREENLLRALDNEKKTAVQFKRALYESGAGFERLKLLSSEAERVKTDALLSDFKEKSMVLEKKLRVAEAKLEEANRKRLELGKKLQEVETHNDLLQREVKSLIAEREAHEAAFSKQKSNLQEWERELQEEKERLCERQRITAKREVKVNETEKAFQLKVQGLERLKKEISLSTSALNRKKCDINQRLANLTAQENNAETLRIDLEMKDKEFLALTEKLNAREREFEVEMDGKRKSLEAEERSRLDGLQYREEEITDRAEKLGKLELSLEIKSERIKEKEKDLEAKLITLEEKENLLKAEEKRLDLEKMQILVEKDSLQTFKDETEKTRTDISQQERKVREEIEKFKIAEEERAENIHMQLKLKEEIETRENLFQKERLSFIAEREAQEATFSMKQNVLQEWERKLQEGEDKLCEDQRITSEREVKVNETEMALKLKEQDLKKAAKEIDFSTSVLKEKEDDINQRLADLTEQEHIAEALRNGLEIKNNQLLALTESLTAREREFEVNMDGKRKSLDDEKRSWLNFLQWKEEELTRRAEELGKLEVYLENKSERIKEKEKDLEVNLRTLKEKGNLLKSDGKRLDLEKKQMLVDKDSLQILKDEIEKMRTDISQRESKIQEEAENLKIPEEERAEYTRLQAELKEEIKKFEKFQLSEADRLKNDRLAMENYVKREWETLEIEKETFAAMMRQEQSLISEKAQLERRQMLHEFEQRRKDLEADLEKKQEELEARMSERERAFMEEREREYNNINYLKEAAQEDAEESRSKRCRIEKDIPLNEKHLEDYELEKHNSFDELQVPNKKVRIEDRESFLLFASSQDIDSEKDDPTRPVEVTTCKSLKIQDLSTEGDVKLKTSETHDKSIEPVITENVECNEEVSSMVPECSTENVREGTLHEDGGNEYEVISKDDDMDDESEDDVPIHKKIWNFLTT